MANMSGDETADRVEEFYVPDPEQIMVTCLLYKDEGRIDLYYVGDILYALGYEVDRKMMDEVGQPKKKGTVFGTLEVMMNMIDDVLQRLRIKSTQVEDQSGQDLEQSKAFITEAISKGKNREKMDVRNSE